MSYRVEIVRMPEGDYAVRREMRATLANILRLIFSEGSMPTEMLSELAGHWVIPPWVWEERAIFSRAPKIFRGSQDECRQAYERYLETERFKALRPIPVERLA